MRFHNHRKGITLLFVVSMIVMFMLLATTFLVISSQYLRGAKAFAQSEVFKREPVNDLDAALYMLLRDTRDPNNPIRTHSLLADVYGYNSIIKASVQNGSAEYVTGSNQAFIQIVLENSRGLNNGPKAFSQNKNSHLGQLLTITNGGMQGITCRIVGHVYNTADGTHYFRVFPYLDDFYTDATNLLTALNAAPDVIVNGKPFHGTGAGFQNGNDTYTASDSFAGEQDVPQLSDEALKPNRRGESESNMLQNYIADGDVNEDYDAPDYQNVFLAGEIPSFSGGNYSVTVLPSFHRPALISSESIRTGAFVPETVLRPIDQLGGFMTLPSLPQTFHPVLGSSPPTPTDTSQFGLDDAIFQWDVDNDNDLVKDSVWIDPNLPILTDKTGDSYKRLFAILCRDLDGKFNLNAHSNRWHLDNEFSVDLEFGNPPFAADEIGNSTISTVASLDGGLTSALPRGIGMGPPEVNMRTILGNNDFYGLMYGDSVNGIWGRNGQDAVNSPALPRPGEVQANLIDFNTMLRFYDVSQGIPIFGGSYGSYPDVQGRHTFGVDYNGMPIFSVTTAATTEFHENEYERVLTSQSGYGFTRTQNGLSGAANYQTDSPFSYAEIERILRGNDNDAATLPNRITALAPGTFNSINTTVNRSQTMFNRMNFGGHSFDMPVLATDVVRELRDQLTASGLSGTVLEEELEEMLPPELFAGIRFDINRIFGDGEDDNGDVVVDNHWGLWSEDLEATPGNLSLISESDLDEVTTLNRHLDLDNDGLLGNADLDEHLVRYQNAKHLYVLMRMILRTSGVDQQAGEIEKVIGNQDLNGDGNFNTTDDLAIFIAQWAINVIDFRDKDSIMTPFEFDLNPFNGWDVDGNPMYSDFLRDGNNAPLAGPVNERDNYVVFGLEKPNLLMTETIAWHDRRTEDTDDETPGVPGNPNPPGKGKGIGNGKKKGKGPGDDNDNDQRLRPLGAMFVELYNAHGVAAARTADVYSMPAEADGYDVGTNNGIDLTRLSLTVGVSDTSGTVATKEAPVWRIVVTDDDVDLDLRNSNGLFFNRQENGAGAQDEIERVIYFVSQDDYQPSDLRYDLPGRVLEENGMFLLTQEVHDALSPLTGIASAVIGTGAIPVGNNPNNPDSYLAPIGRRTDVDQDNEDDDVKYSETRSLSMVAGSSVNSMIVRDLDAGGNPVNYEKATLSIPIEHLNVSEPIGGYNLGDRTTLPKTVEDDDGTRYTETIYRDSDGAPYVFDGPLDRNSRPAANGDNRFDGSFPVNRNESMRSYRVLHLQRLANPLAGWHPRSNPYLTVDSMPIDLSVFDGADTSDLAAFDQADGFGTKERGETQGVNRNLWRVEPNRIQPNRPAGNDDHYFSYYIEDPTTATEEESLGHTKLGAQDQINHSFDFTNNPIYNGNAKTYPSLAWNNRPFVSQYELMLVPHTSSSKLLRKYHTTSDLNQDNPNAPPGIAANIFEDNANSLHNGYGHLLNWFQGSEGLSGNNGPDFHRILDSVYVPSRFSQTETYLDPDVFGQIAAPDWYLDVDEATGNGDSSSSFDAADPGFRAPMNLISQYREPGKVNINTISTRKVWTGINGGDSGRGGHETASFADLANSRRDGAGTQVLGAINGPTFFPRPFRGSHAGNLIPDVTSVPVNNPANSGLLRNHVNGSNQPLLAAPSSTVNSDRHPSLRYLSRSRLGNLTTTRSNVYAVWITMGYFKYIPERNQIGEELGASTGEAERHRAFYMIDRSIPVGFEPGKNHNVDKTIMLRRYIE
ncbi:MAG: hypothetical protein P8M80_00785 [Pirellulaceae bacterium]|nr:hypothetical protein [Pirellulaceae bacterium]